MESFPALTTYNVVLLRSTYKFHCEAYERLRLKRNRWIERILYYRTCVRDILSPQICLICGDGRWCEVLVYLMCIFNFWSSSVRLMARYWQARANYLFWLFISCVRVRSTCGDFVSFSWASMYLPSIERCQMSRILWTFRKHRNRWSGKIKMKKSKKTTAGNEFPHYIMLSRSAVQSEMLVKSILLIAVTVCRRRKAQQQRHETAIQ